MGACCGRGSLSACLSSVMTKASDSAICCAIVPDAPAGASPNSVRRERQVASALRRRTDFAIVSLTCGTDGIAGCACPDARVRVWRAGLAAGGATGEAAAPRAQQRDLDDRDGLGHSR